MTTCNKHYRVLIEKKDFWVPLRTCDPRSLEVWPGSYILTSNPDNFKHVAPCFWYFLIHSFFLQDSDDDDDDDDDATSLLKPFSRKQGSFFSGSPW